MLPEGTMLVLQSMRTSVRIAHQRTFVPTCRRVDERLAVWRGFDRIDEKRDRATLLHRLTELAG